MISGAFVFLSILAILLGYFLTNRRKWKNSPPGPKRYPIVGSLLQIDKMTYKSFSKWAKEYGPVCRVDLGNIKTVVISDYKLVKEIYSDSTFSGRQDFSQFDIIPDGTVHGIINSEGEHWEELRRFTLRQLRDFGFGKNSMEDSIMMEVNELIDTIKSRGNNPVADIKDRLLFAVVNSLWAIVTGQRINDKETLLEMTRQQQKTFTDIIEKGSLLIFIPSLAKYFPKLSGFAKARESIDLFANYFKKPLQEHIKTYDPDHERDFIDVFLKESKKTTDPKSAFQGKVGESHLLGILNDLYQAGTDTTSTTLAWLFLYLSKFPEVQKKLQNEIESVTGNSRPVSVSDRPKMPYTEAVISECLRWSSIVPAGVNHRSVRDAEFKGYHIPKNCLITQNMHYIHHDPKIWGDPENFRPERFLSPDGKTFKKHEALMPFSIGRRQCLGESLARDSLFLFSTNIYQRFNVEFDKNGPDNGFEPEPSFILTPKPFQLLFKDRME